ncbi:T9SS type A sorting domain-containing protein [Oceanihabitans sp. 2_MG-2023]|uniref:T9SS type A sorting domain-containing protein n=1 Tax=Oceanihabitans sp. 2_MG-2023 TaxID=3062661 RepID=UPI0026E38664|nr:T9SS type A sorting domain-containing protein [Oceanihabitans sp. 2_MG-2023]MDO6597338.1 T9SS type A sorting domain-containing protein [Oceanihabitans sp. 2_MG-2023]
MKKITFLLLLSICFSGVYAQSNGNCSGAYPLEPNVAQTGSLNTASNSGISSSCSSFFGDYWYSFIAGASGEVAITSSVGFAFFTDCTGSNEVFCSANSTNNIVVQSLTEGETYFVQLFTFPEPCRGANCGEYEIIISGNTLSTQDLVENVFTVYPNPVNDVLNINAKKEITNIVVYNVIGKQVLNSTPNALNVTVDLSNFRSGYYIVKLNSNTNSEVIKVLKK